MLANMKGGNLAKKSGRLGGFRKKIDPRLVQLVQGNSVTIPKGPDDSPLKTKSHGPFLKGEHEVKEKQGKGKL